LTYNECTFQTLDIRILEKYADLFDIKIKSQLQLQNIFSTLSIIENNENLTPDNIIIDEKDEKNDKNDILKKIIDMIIYSTNLYDDKYNIYNDKIFYKSNYFVTNNTIQTNIKTKYTQCYTNEFYKSSNNSYLNTFNNFS